MNRLFSLALVAAAATLSLGASAQELPPPPLVQEPPTTNNVPEPASLLLVGVAIAAGRGATAYRRRQALKSKRAED